MEKRDVLDSRYLAISTTRSQFMLITYILFLTKLQKGKPLKKGFALFKNDITNNLGPQKPVVY
jgi:hypothetical protein